MFQFRLNISEKYKYDLVYHFLLITKNTQLIGLKWYVSLNAKIYLVELKFITN